MSDCALEGNALGFQRDLYASLAMSGLALSVRCPGPVLAVAGYYNAVRELGGGKALLEQDVMQATAHGCTTESGSRCLIWLGRRIVQST